MSPRLLRAALATLLTAVPAGCAHKASAPTPPQFPACDPSATTQTISFVHVNDLHSNYQLDAQGNSPYAIIRGFYESTLASNPYTLFTSGGDEFEKGAVAEQMSAGESTLEILQGMKFDVRVIGNHDYGWSESIVLKESHDPHAHVLSSNIHYTGTDPQGFGAEDYVEMQVGCVKIGFFGLTSGPWNDQDQYESNGNFYPDFPTNLNYTAVAQPIVAAHRSNVDLMVAVTHIGVGSKGTGPDVTLATTVPGIDVVLGGHSHTLITALSLYSTTGTSIIQAGSFANYVARLDVTLDLKTRKIVSQNYLPDLVEPYTGEITPNAPTQAMVQSVLTKYAPDGQKPICTLKAGLDTNEKVGTLAAQAAMQRFGADAAVVDLGTVWSNPGAGPLSPQDMLNMFKVEREPPGTPGFNSFYTLQIQGDSLQTLVDGHTSGWAVTAPATINPSQTYLLAIQKRTAFHPDVYLPPGVTVIGTPMEGAEAWDVLTSYAKTRQAACQYIDDDSTIPGCTPG
jgi:2',3'-cyclic-nucleotide 2'-phosphodiesterase (5'-nucleotidase family)